MPRLVPVLELRARHAERPADHPRNVASAWRDGGRRRAERFAYPDPWLWDDCPATLDAYMAGWKGEPRP